MTIEVSEDNLFFQTDVIVDQTLKSTALESGKSEYNQNLGRWKMDGSELKSTG